MADEKVGLYDWMGTGTLSGGTVTIANAKAKTTSRIFISPTGAFGSNGNLRVVTKSNGSFVVQSDDLADNGTFDYFIMNPYVPSGGGSSPDTTAPTVPTMNAPVVVSDTQINVSWSASSDAVGVTGYDLQRSTAADFSANLVTTNLGNVLSANVTGLAASTQYFWRVRAHDAVPNNSAYSASVNATTNAPGGSYTEEKYVNFAGATVVDGSNTWETNVDGSTDYDFSANGTTITNVSPAIPNGVAKSLWFVSTGAGTATRTIAGFTPSQPHTVDLFFMLDESRDNDFTVQVNGDDFFQFLIADSNAVDTAWTVQKVTQTVNSNSAGEIAITLIAGATSAVLNGAHIVLQ